MTDYLIEQFSTLNDPMRYIMTFLISMFPIVELRGAVPVGTALGLNTYLVLLISIIGNIIPVPFIILFARRIIEWLKKRGMFSWFTDWMERKASKNAKKVLKYEKLGLFIFVAIPIPGTGAWTGAIVASLLGMRIKTSFPPILCGVITAGLIMTLGSQLVKYILM